MDVFNIGTSTPRNPTERTLAWKRGIAWDVAGFAGCRKVAPWLFVGKGLIVG